MVQVNRALAPLGADRFYALVQAGFYNNSAFFRVVPKFVLQVQVTFSIPVLTRSYLPMLHPPPVSSLSPPLNLSPPL